MPQSVRNLPFERVRHRNRCRRVGPAGFPPLPVQEMSEGKMGSAVTALPVTPLDGRSDD